ncbi:MAG: hypothetical protein DYH12_33400, partial [Sorangiineae bacterium PRO1]|nr:hypothetical protein [Sorangiineae bacterium PRO1]
MRRLGPLLVVAACSVVSEQKTFDAPSPEGFHRVSEMLHARCGSLDCHGQAGRSLRLYGSMGLRLDPSDVPGVPRKTADPAEAEANYVSVLALEPEILAAVFQDGGRDPERLTLVRKGRLLESHKGGEALDALGRRCFVSWLEGAVDGAACNAAAVLARPPGFVLSGSGGSGGSGGAGG